MDHFYNNILEATRNLIMKKLVITKAVNLYGLEVSDNALKAAIKKLVLDYSVD